MTTQNIVPTDTPFDPNILTYAVTGASIACFLEILSDSRYSAASAFMVQCISFMPCCSTACCGTAGGALRLDS